MFFVFMFIIIRTLNNTKRFVVTDDLRVNRVIKLTAKRKIIYRIEHIRLTSAIVSDEAIHLRREINRSLPNVLIIDDGKFSEYHLWCKVTPFISQKRKKSIRNFSICNKMSNFATQNLALWSYKETQIKN